MRSTTVYVVDAAEFDCHRKRLKLRPCPHCRAVGFLICHGYLRGYGEHCSEKIQRGWRMFCSNRGRRSGCGRTYAVLISIRLYHRRVGAERLWKFLQAILGGASRQSAWEKVSAPFCMETGYKLWGSFIRNQSHLRSFLHRRAKPVALERIVVPALQLIAHLKAAFPGSSCPAASFQNTLQQAFLVR